MEKFKIRLNKYYKLGELMEWLADTYGWTSDPNFVLLDSDYKKIHWSEHVWGCFFINQTSVEKLKAIGYLNVTEPLIISRKWIIESTKNVYVKHWEIINNCWTIVLADLKNKEFEKLWNKEPEIDS